jgi:hypothetical protein
MNPWFILGGLLSLFVAFGAGHHQGHKTGINAQKVASQEVIDTANKRTQGIIDGYNTQMADQKAIATTRAIAQRDEVIALQAERDKFKSQLGAEHVKNQDTTRRLSAAYAAYSLRFKPDIGSGSWHSAGSGEDAKGGPACDAPSAVVQLPEALTRDLRQFATDADELNDDYKLCYGYTALVGDHTPQLRGAQ